MYLVAVTLWVRRGAEEAFRSFEREVLDLLEGHGGVLVRAARLAETARDLDAPYEFHLLEFPSQEAFEAYLADPTRARSIEQRATLIAKTEMVAGSALDGP